MVDVPSSWQLPCDPQVPPHTAFADIVAVVRRTCARFIDSRKKKSAEEVLELPEKVVFLSTLSKWLNRICKFAADVTKYLNWDSNIVKKI
jgi:hypothetical protein